MLAKNNRLKKNKEFDSVFKEGKTAYGSFLGIKVKSNSFNFNRFGVLLGTKVSKSAVIRNKYKRRIKDILKKQNPQLKVGHDGVIIVLPAIVNKDYYKLTNEIKTTFNKLKLYK